MARLGSIAVTVAVAGLVALAVLAGGSAVQQFVLPQPSAAARAAATAAGWFGRYQLAISSFRINDGAPVHGRCLQHWFPTPTGNDVRGTLLQLDTGLTLAGVHPHPLTLVHARRPEPPSLQLAQLRLAGCTSTLSNQLVQAARSVTPLRLLHAAFAGRAALLLQLRTGHGRLTPPTDKPIAIALTNEHYHSLSRIHLAPATTTMLNNLEHIQDLALS